MSEPTTLSEYLRRQRERAGLEKTKHTHQMYGCMTDVLTHDHGVAQVPDHTHPGHICDTLIIGEPIRYTSIGMPDSPEAYTPSTPSNWVDYGPAVY